LKTSTAKKNLWLCRLQKTSTAKSFFWLWKSDNLILAVENVRTPFSRIFVEIFGKKRTVQQSKIGKFILTL